MFSLNLSLATKPLVFHKPHLTFAPRGRGAMAGPRSTGPVPQFVSPGSALYATAVARGDGVAPAAVVSVVVEDLLQNCPEGVGPGEGCNDGGPNEERVGMVEQGGMGHDVVGHGDVNDVGKAVGVGE